MQVLVTEKLIGGERLLRIAVQGGRIVVHNVDTSELVVDRPCYGFEQFLADEVDRLQSQQK